MKRTSAAHTALTLCFGLCALLVRGCSHQAIDMTAPTSPAANQWLRLAPPFDDRSLKQPQWKLVLKPQQPVAERMLLTVAWVRLTGTQAGELTGGPHGDAAGDTVPYLLRAVGSPVGTSGFHVEVRPDGDVLVEGGARNHYALPIERRAIVAWLNHPPREVYVSFSVAE